MTELTPGTLAGPPGPQGAQGAAGPQGPPGLGVVPSGFDLITAVPGLACPPGWLDDSPSFGGYYVVGQPTAGSTPANLTLNFMALPVAVCRAP